MPEDTRTSNTARDGSDSVSGEVVVRSTSPLVEVVEAANCEATVAPLALFGGSSEEQPYTAAVERTIPTTMDIRRARRRRAASADARPISALVITTPIPTFRHHGSCLQLPASPRHYGRYPLTITAASKPWCFSAG
jgi:hypothetical protein